MTRIQLIALFILSFSLSALYAQRPPNDLTIWFSHPASNWNEALPVGNGRLGAMVFGNIQSERLQLNEETVWSGQPGDFVNPEAKSALPQVRKLLFEGKYADAQKLAQNKIIGPRGESGSYQTLGDMQLDFDYGRGEAANYRRELNIETAIAKTVFTIGSVTYTREVFSSKPNEALVVRLTANKPASVTVRIKLSRPGNKALIETSGSAINMSEHVNEGVGVKIFARSKVENKGGSTQSGKDTIKIDKADTVLIFLTASTNYWGGDPAALTQTQLAAASLKSYDALQKIHTEDYQKYFKRVDLDLGSGEAVYFPTDARLVAMQGGNVDPNLIKLYYQFGRYLLISSSRPGDLPANLQGIWADGLRPPWSADYHININIQMNYWLAEMTNLSELHEPFLKFIDALRADGRKTAKDMYGLPGVVAHYTTNAWLFTETSGNTQYAMWPMAMAWCSQHLWEHYLFTEDKRYLSELGYPVLKEAAEFCAAWLTENPVTKQLVSGPSISPENRFKTKSGDIATMVMGPTMDHMIIRDLFQNTVAAAKVLNKDAAFRKKLEDMLTRLAPTKIGSDGRIMEWTEEFAEPDPGHRHISHLFGLHPGREITKQKSPELMAAARKTIDFRLSNGGGHTGWSRAWIINFFARLQDGEEAYKNIVALLQKSTLPNLFDTHPPFQIDGNFGATSGITEMLLQSHSGEIQLLPALPTAWKKGYIHGLVARGGFDVDIDWEGGKLSGLKILSKLGNACIVRYGDKVMELKTERGKTYSFNGLLQQQ